MRILFSWIGDADLGCMLDDPTCTEEQRDAVHIYFKKKGKIPSRAKNEGPIKTLLKFLRFEKIYLFSNYPAECTHAYKKYLDQNIIETRLAEIKDPTDYEIIFKFVDKEMGAIISALTQNGYELSIFLSPGTPAMAAVWVLLGKSKYPSQFYQTHNSKVINTKIPFDLVVDYIPELLHNSDARLQHLANRYSNNHDDFRGISGKSEQIQLAVSRASKAALRDVSILITGESGTGKEIFARAIHNASKRSKGPFIPINCAALSAELLESELFGFEKGAHSKADKMHKGAFEQADGGTLFLDEIGECSPDIQAKLLRAIQSADDTSLCTREIRRLGAEESITVNVRILAATNQNLLEMIKGNRFRDDLYYRLAVITLKLPPLRERNDDHKIIAIDLLNRINSTLKVDDNTYTNKKLSVSALRFISLYEWPGNIRQLNSALLQAAVMADSDIINRSDIELTLQENCVTPMCINSELPEFDGQVNLDNIIDDIRKKYINEAMIRANGNASKAARLLGYKSHARLKYHLKN